MRYKLGESYLFIKVNFTPSELRFGSLYCPWKDTLHSITIKRMVCKEHHKVPNHHDPKGELIFDGFIFALEGDDRRWLNQYPTASYTQTSDSQDHIVRVEAKTDADMDEHFEGAMQDITSFMDTIQRGIRDLTKQDAMKEVASLQQFFDDLQKRLADEFKLTGIIQPVVFLRDGVEESHPSITEVVLQPI